MDKKQRFGLWLALAAIAIPLFFVSPAQGITPELTQEPTWEPTNNTPDQESSPEQESCWDCPDSNWQAERPRSSYCSPEALVANPQHLDLCFPEKWAWVCFTEDPTKNIKEHCAMYRRDLDPLGIFATPPPMPTPEPTPTPELTPEPTPEPTPDLTPTAPPTP